MRFSEIVGQEAAISILKNSIKSRRIHHSYLFLGPGGVGKKTTAIAFAKALNCETLEGCDSCNSCRKIENRIHPDVQMIGPVGDSSAISIEQIRNLQKSASYKPFEANWKIYIIDDAGALTSDAANCLLKTLEEPPGQVVLILVTENVYRILPTVRSRCQPILFRQISRGLVEKLLKEKFGVAPEKASFLAWLSAGSIGKAVYYMEKEFPQFTEILKQILAGKGPLAPDYETVFRLSAEISRDRESALELLNLLMADLGREFMKYPSPQKRKEIERVMEASDLIRRNVNVSLAIERMLLG